MRKEVLKILVWIPILILMFLAGLKNPLFLIISLSALLIITNCLFKIKNWKQNPSYLFTIVIAEILVLIYVYLFKNIYLQDLSSIILFISFVLIVLMETVVYIYFIKRTITLKC